MVGISQGPGPEDEGPIQIHYNTVSSIISIHRRYTQGVRQRARKKRRRVSEGGFDLVRRGGARMFLRAVARPLMAKVKQTTGIVGLDVVPNARDVLIGLYRKTLKEIQAVPEDEGYRKAVESFTRQRLKVCEEEQDWEAIENRLGCGQVEELIEEAQDELKLISHMIGN